MPLWTSQDAVDATGGECAAEWLASGVSIDTRTLEPGDLFVALTDQRDGHDFVAQAFKKGAAAALVSRRPVGVGADAPLLVVDDVQNGLEALGRAARARTNARVIAVTGSVGKTSTKDMLRVMLAGQGQTHAAEQSYNNQWGVPLTLARMPQDSAFAVIEIGMNHPGEIAPLTAMARPHVALITNVAAVHLNAFVSIEGIAREKAAIFSGLEPGGVAVVNADLDQSDLIIELAENHAARVDLFGTGKNSTMRLDSVQVTENVTILHANYRGTGVLIKVSVPGRHYAMNAVGALAGVVALGGDLAISVCDLANWQPPTGRGTRQTIRLDVVEEHLAITLINDAFNANPLSMAAALEVLAATAPGSQATGHGLGRRVAILGDMLELGPGEQQLHRDIAADANLGEIDLVHCVGPLMRELHDRLPVSKQGVWFATADEMTTAVAGLLRAGDVVLVKGSKGIWVSRVVDAIRNLGQVPDQQAKGNN